MLNKNDCRKLFLSNRLLQISHSQENNENNPQENNPIVIRLASGGNLHKGEGELWKFCVGVG